MSINDVVAYPLQIDTPEGIATVTAVHKVVERDDVIQCKKSLWEAGGEQVPAGVGWSR